MYSRECPVGGRDCASGAIGSPSQFSGVRPPSGTGKAKSAHHWQLPEKKGNRVEMSATFPRLDLPPFLEVVDELGRGGQALVVRAKDHRLAENDENGNSCPGKVAVKCYPRSFIERPDNTRRLRREVTNHRCLSHLHVVGFREVRVTRNYIVMLLNYVDGGTLKDYVIRKGRLSEGTARWIFQQIVLGVDYCHQRSVISRDINLDNVLYSESERIAILCDFGLSRTDDFIDAGDSNGRPLSMVGNYGYVAPEIVTRSSGSAPTPEDVKRSDIFACGVCLFKMLAGADEFPLNLRLPVGISDKELTNSPATSFRSSEFLRTVRSLVDNGGVDLMAPYNVLGLTNECKAFLNNVLNFNPERRFTMDDIWSDAWFLLGLPEPKRAVRSYNKKVSDAAYLDDKLSVLQSENDLIDRVMLAASPDFVPDGYWY